MSFASVGIVIPARNAEGTLARAVESCFAQGVGNIEVVIVDDCSSDATEQVARGLASLHPGQVTYVRNDSRVNALESRRRGAELCNSDYVMFLDADDELAQGSIAAAREAAKSQDADIVAFTILPCVADGVDVDANAMAGYTSMYAVPDAMFRDDDIVHAVFSDSRVVWSMVGKLFKRSVVTQAWGHIPFADLFQAEDAYFMFVAASLAGCMVCDSAIPPYRYFIGTGGTASGAVAGLSVFQSVCKNVLVADAVEGYLASDVSLNRFAGDYANLRRALIMDPVFRFPDFVEADCRPLAFDALIQSWPVHEVIAAFAERRWNESPQFFHSLSSWFDASCCQHPQSGVVALVYHSLGCGGIEKVMRTMASVLLASGKQVILLLDEGAEVSDLPSGAIVEYLPDCFESLGAKYGEQGRRLQDVLERYRVDCVIHHQWMGEALPWDALLIRALGIPCIVHTHGAFTSALELKFPHLLYIPLLYGVFSHVVCLSDIDAAFWRSLNKHVSVVFNQTDPIFSQDAAPALRSRDVAWCGRIDPQKQPFEMLLVARELCKRVPDARIRVFGPASSDAYLSDLKEACRAMGLADRVIWEGEKTAEELVRAYADCGAYLHTAHLEGFPISILEAKSCGLPVAMYDLPYLILREPDSGVLTAPIGDTMALAANLAMLLQDDLLRRQKSEESLNQSRVIASFDYGAFWIRLIDGLSDVASDGAPSQVPDSLDLDVCLVAVDAQRRALQDHAREVAELSCTLESTRAELREARELLAQTQSALEATAQDRDGAYAQINSKAGFLLRAIRKAQQG